MTDQPNPPSDLPEDAIRRLRELEAPASEASRASFLLLIGASGSGKSSLLRAGLAPRLAIPGAFPEVDMWRRAIVSADADPFAQCHQRRHRLGIAARRRDDDHRTACVR